MVHHNTFLLFPATLKDTFWYDLIGFFFSWHVWTCTKLDVFICVLSVIWYTLCLSACPNKSGEGLILVDFSHSDFRWISHTPIWEDFSSSVEMPHHSVCPSGRPAASSESRHQVSLLQIPYQGRISSTKIQRCNLLLKIWLNLEKHVWSGHEAR